MQNYIEKYYKPNKYGKQSIYIKYLYIIVYVIFMIFANNFFIYFIIKFLIFWVPL